MHEELVATASTCASAATSSGSWSSDGRVRASTVNGRTIGTRAVSPTPISARRSSGWSASSIRPRFLGRGPRRAAEQLQHAGLHGAEARRADRRIDGRSAVQSTAREFRTDLLLSRDITSRTFSFYYPRTRPQAAPRCLIVSSTNARYEDWAGLPEEEYEASKRDLIETTLDALEKYVPNCRERIDHVEAATPRTFQHYTKHLAGASFGTKFEGLAVSRGLPEQIGGLYHAGSVGIIMSGWLGAINYGVIVANDVEGMPQPISEEAICYSSVTPSAVALFRLLTYL
jgi:hypothetical protein